MMVSFSSRKITILIGTANFLLVAALASSSSGSPHFEGLFSATPTGPDSIALNWDPAQVDQSPAGQITYLIYQATQSGAQNNDRPSYTMKDTSYQVTGLTSNTRYYFVLRAKDRNGQVDSNHVERSAVTFGRWVKKTPATAPPPRVAHGMAYDSKSGKVIVFGGRNQKNGEMNDTWIYNTADNTWIQRLPATPVLPSPRSVRNLAYVDGRVIVVGGITSINPTILDHETWIYNVGNNTWTSSSTPADLSGYGISPNFVYDSANKVVVLFGGREATVDGHVTGTGETWEFDVTRETWTQIFPTTSPSPRKHHAMVYDSLNRKVILFGGEILTGKSNETWTYDASSNTWTQIFPTTSPSPRSHFEMVYDSHNQQVTLFGGILTSKHQDLTNETWGYNIVANTWIPINLPNVPPGHFHHAMVYNPVSKKVILFGGATVLCHDTHCFAATGYVNDTWVYE